MLPTGEPICTALLDQTLARSVFRLHQPSRTILSRWKPSAWASRVLHRPIETTRITGQMKAAIAVARSLEEGG